MRWILLPALAAAVTACAGDGPPAREAVAVVDTAAGIERWSYRAGGAAALDWSLDTILVLGDAFAADEYQFDEVARAGLAGDGQGGLYLLDRQGTRILEYGPDGRHEATYGRQGEGPGELSQPLGLTVGPGDTVWVTDFANSRLTGYPPGAGEPRLIPYSPDAGFPGSAFAALGDGFIQEFRPIFRFGPGQDDAAGEAPRRIPLLRLDGLLQPLDTLWTVQEPPADVIEMEIAQRTLVMMMARQFEPAFQWVALSDGGVVVSDTAAYLLRLLGPDGAVQRVIARDPPPRPVTEADREALRQQMREREGVGGTSIRIGGAGPDEETRARMLEQRLANMTFADLVPRVLALRVDLQDRIWVGVTVDHPTEIGRIDIYRPDGTLLGELRDFPMPDVFLGDDRIGLLRRDELDVQQVVVLRVVEGDVAD